MIGGPYLQVMFTGFCEAEIGGIVQPGTPGAIPDAVLYLGKTNPGGCPGIVAAVILSGNIDGGGKIDGNENGSGQY